jgi:hypothetical protein
MFLMHMAKGVGVTTKFVTAKLITNYLYESGSAAFGKIENDGSESQKSDNRLLSACRHMGP